MKKRPSITGSATQLIVPFALFSLAWATPLAAQEGSTGTPARETVFETILEEKSVFDLNYETRRMVLRGTREATIEAKIAGRNLPLNSGNPVVNYPGQITNSAEFLDPYGDSFPFTAFRQAYDFPFDFGNGVRKVLRIVPVRLYSGSPDKPTGTWRDNALLDFAYSGEIVIDDVRYTVEVVQGASPAFKDRLSYPGYFDSPDVNVLLYRVDTGERLPGIGKIQKINGRWYEFMLNPSGENLVVNRVNATGVIRINTGDFPQIGFEFTQGRLLTTKGWALSLKDLDFSDGVEEVPAADYTFTEMHVVNNGQLITFVWHPDIDGMEHGSLTVPAGAEVDLKIGRSAKVEFGFDPRYNPDVRTFYDSEWVKFRVFDADLGGAVVALDSQPYISSYTNSAGEEISVDWHLKPCGWDGMWWCTSEEREYPVTGNPIGGKDSKPPKVDDIRSITITCRLRGLFGNVSASMQFKVRNETQRLHGRFYDFDEPIDAFPDFERIAPKLEIPNATMGMQASEPWLGLPAQMADTFAAVYEFDFCPIVPAATKNPETLLSNYTFNMTVGGGAARMYIDDKLVMECENPDSAAKVFTSEPIGISGPDYRRIRVEYYHNTGDASLSLSCVGKIPPYYTYNLKFDPTTEETGKWFIGINPAYLPAKLDARTSWKGGTTFVIEGNATSPDGIDRVDYFLDGSLVATSQGSELRASLESVDPGSKVVLRAVDVNGYGTLFTLDAKGESLEEWLERYGLSDPDGDEDGDGVSNRDEFIAGTSPLPPPPFSMRQASLDGNTMTLRWDGEKAGSRQVAGYHVEFSSNLKDWEPFGTPITLREDGIYSRQISTGNLGSKVFFRVVPDLR